MIQADVPSPVDLRKMSDAKEWESSAMQRPFRKEFFEAFTNELQQLNKASLHVLELGSGPGFLAQHLLSNIDGLTMTLLDFSPAMHELAQKRIGKNVEHIKFIERSFKETAWPDDLGKFDAVITNQAVHELRHKRYATTLHEQVRPLLIDGGIYLVCDHYCGEDGMKNDQLYMTIVESRECLIEAGYQVTEILVKGGRVLNRAT